MPEGDDVIEVVGRRQGVAVDLPGELVRGGELLGDGAERLADVERIDCHVVRLMPRTWD